MKVKSKELSLETYLDFLHSPQRPDLTIPLLNQIIRMHGFKKICQRPKKVILDALETIALIDPSRSTLNENISSDARLTLDNVIADIGELNWQECNIISIENISKENHISVINDNDSNHTAVAVVNTTRQPKAVRSKSKDESTCTSFPSEGTSSSASKTKHGAVEKDSKGKRKRVPMKELNDGTCSNNL